MIRPPSYPRGKRPSDKTLLGILCEYPQETPLAESAADSLLNCSLSALEESIRLICVGYNRFKLLLLARRWISPQMFAIYTDPPFIAFRPLRILTLAILKYGSSEPDPRLYGGELPVYDALTYETRLDIEHLCELSMAYSRIVGLCKSHDSGAKILVFGTEIGYRLDAELAHLPDMENSRLQRDSLNYLSPIASISEFDPADATSSKQADLMGSGVLFATPLYEAAKPREYWPRRYSMPQWHGSLPVEVNYTDTLVDMSEVQHLLSIYHPSSSSRWYPWRAEQLITLLRYMSLIALTNNMVSDSKGRFFYLTGCDIHEPYSLSTLIRETIASSEQGESAIDQSATFHDIIRGITLTDEDLTSIDIGCGLATSFVYDMGSHIIVDWTMMQDFILSALYTVSSQQVNANIKGSQFENGLYSWLRRRVPNVLK